MNCTLSQLRNKEVISRENGCRIGYVDDLEVDIRSAEVRAIVIYGRFRFLGLFGRKPDCVIPWSKIELIGEDTREFLEKTPRKAQKTEVFSRILKITVFLPVTKKF